MLASSRALAGVAGRWLIRRPKAGGTVRSFTRTAGLRIKGVQLPPRLKVDESEIQESFLKGGGAGGQKINKTNSAVQLQHTPTGIVVKSQATRSRSQNRKIARQLLAERLEEAEKGDEARTAIKASIKQKKKASKKKKSKRKYRALDEAKQAASNAAGAETAEQHEDQGESEIVDDAEDEEHVDEESDGMQRTSGGETSSGDSESRRDGVGDHR